MYAPEIYGRSEAQTLKISKISEIIPGKIPQEAVTKYANGSIVRYATEILIMIIIMIGIGVLLLKKRGATIKQIKEKVLQILKNDKLKPPTPTSKTQNTDNAPNK